MRCRVATWPVGCIEANRLRKNKNDIGEVSLTKFYDRTIRVLLMTTATSCAFSYSSTGEAQTASAAPGSPSNSSANAATPQADGLQEIVVTAQKRSESLQKVPVSVQVIQGKDLQATNRNSIQDLGQTLPAVHIVNSGNEANTLNIRGIGSGAGNPAFDQSVATFDDDIYIGRSRMIQSTFLDVDRIEVLKGPQSTFFGNNAIAGALNITTKKPDNQFDGYARALYGSYGQFALEGASSIPVSDTLSVRVAGTFNGQNGWIKNIVTGGKAPHERNVDGRATVAWHPTSDFDATLKVEDGRNKTTGSTSDIPGQFTNCPPPVPLKTNGIKQFCSAAIAAGTPLGLDNDKNASLPGQYALLDTNQEVLTMNYHLGGTTLTSVTGHLGYKYVAHSDNAGVGATPVSTISFAPERYKQFSQELRITSPTNEPIEYLAGVYYQRDTLDEQIIGNSPYATPLLPYYASLGLLTPAQLAGLGTPVAFDVSFRQKETVESAFGAVNWNATNKLKFNVGLRGTRVHKSFDGDIEYGQATSNYASITPYAFALQKAVGFFLGAPGNYPYARTDSAILGSAGVQYQVTPTAMAYFTYSRGFKAGGFNAISPSLIGGVSEPTFGPEHVDSYEAGVKTKLLNNHLLFNLDVFREDYSDLQVNALVQFAVNSTIAVANAATSRSQGVELETQWVISRNFNVAANVTYLDATYVDYPNAAPTTVQKQGGLKTQNLSGRPLDFASKWSGSINAEYKESIGDNHRLLADIGPFFQTKYYNSAGTDDPYFLIKGNVRLDGKLTFESTKGRWAVDLIGKNLTNAVIPVSYGTNDALGGKEEPRNIAVQFRYTW